jgi:Ca-activated chloride channel family protein
VSNFFTKVKDPVLASPKITFPDSVRVSKLYPSPVPDLFKGEQIILAGRYSGNGDGAVQIEGTVSGENKRFAYDVKFADTANDHEFIPRLWATRRVGYLLDEIRLRGESKELKDEVTELARKYSVVTPYTAYLIHEDEARRGIAANVRTLRFTDRAQLERAERFYLELNESKDGASGVAGSRSYNRLKSADASGPAILAGGEESLRAATPLASATPGVALRSRDRGAPGRVPLTLDSTAGRAEAAKLIADQGRFAGGKTFFLNDGKWIDADLQKATNANIVEVKLGSAEYFELLKKAPNSSQWLALGEQVEFVLDRKIYQVK